MKKQTKIEYVFTEKETKIIKDCLTYVIHRKKEHSKPRNISLEAVENLLRYL
jgi:hypothetical protein